MISIEELKQKIEEKGYYAEELLIYEMYNALLLLEEGGIHPGQDIYALCLEGPPGAGKTKYAEIYQEIANDIFGNVIEIKYQCDPKTGKNELYEDIRMTAAVTHDPEKIIISGILVKAIKAVNSGKKVILFIDEYDKAREETDAFLLDFLQSGELSTTQNGDMKIDDKYKGNLQVILCKNDMREELSGPLSRRNRINRLDYMKPEIFYKVAHKLFCEPDADQVNEGLINLVSLMYEKAYENRQLYNRLPACSEMLIAIEDASRLLKRANAPQNFVYEIIVKNMFKSKDDREAFESSLEKSKSGRDVKLSDLIKTMKDSKVSEKQGPDINSIIADKVFATTKAELEEQKRVLANKIAEAQKLIDEYKTKFAEMETRRKAEIAAEIEKIRLQGGELVASQEVPTATKIFSDESSRIKRGYDIFKTAEDWTTVATIKRPGLAHDYTISKLVEYASKLDITIFENGILLKTIGDLKLIAITSFDESGKLVFKILSSTPVIPSTFFKDIYNFINFINQCYSSQTIVEEGIESEIANRNCTIDFCGVVYNEGNLPFDEVEHNVYSVFYSQKCESARDTYDNKYWDIDQELPYGKPQIPEFDEVQADPAHPEWNSSIKCDDPSKAIEISNRIMAGQRKVLKP